MTTCSFCPVQAFYSDNDEFIVFACKNDFYKLNTPRALVRRGVRASRELRRALEGEGGIPEDEE